MIVGEWWFRLVVRAILALLAVWTLVLSEDRYAAFHNDFSANFRMDTGLWLAWLGPVAGAGFLFGLATWLPFSRVRYLWSRLLLAAVALAPIVRFWWVFIHGATGGWFARSTRLTGPSSQIALAVLVGVAIASGFRTARSTGD